LFIARAIVIARGGEISITSTAESCTTLEVAAADVTACEGLSLE
jgi:hypothetical protein